MISPRMIGPARITSFAAASLFAAACGGGDITTPATQINDCRDLLQVQTGTLPTPQPLWQKSATSGTLPPERWFQAGAYDAANDRLIVFGGIGTAGALNDVWVLNAASTSAATWTQLQPGGTARPAARSKAVVAYDAVNNRLIIFGGSDASNHILGDLWTLSNANGTGGAPVWTQLTEQGTPPSRTGMAAAYDAHNARLYMFGGVSCTTTACTPSSDVFVANMSAGSGNFSRVATSGTAPAPRYYASAAFDASGNRLIVFGGNSSTSLNTDASQGRADTWILNDPAGGHTWSQLDASTTPSGRMSAGLAFDEARGRIIIFGGTDQNNSVINDLWLVRGLTGGTAWTKYETGTPLPDARTSPVMAYSAAQDRLIVFGGNGGGSNLLNDVWVVRSSPPNAASVRIASAANTVCSGYQLAFSAVAMDSAGVPIPANITWTSSNPGVLEVAPDGHAIAHSPGTADIKACVGAVCAQTSASVKAAPAPPPTNNTPSTLRVKTEWVQEITACYDLTGATSNVSAITLAAEGGAPASGYTWTITPGSTFPQGITVDPLTGILHHSSAAIPAPNRYPFNMTVSDGSNTAKADMVLNVSGSDGCPVALFGQPGGALRMMDGKVGRSYGASLAAFVGGDPGPNGPPDRNLTWKFADGQLPPGLVIDAARGIVRGTPSTAGPYSFRVTVSNSRGIVAPPGATYTIIVTTSP